MKAHIFIFGALFAFTACEMGEVATTKAQSEENKNNIEAIQQEYDTLALKYQSAMQAIALINEDLNEHDIRLMQQAKVQSENVIAITNAGSQIAANKNQIDTNRDRTNANKALIDAAIDQMNLNFDTIETLGHAVDANTFDISNNMLEIISLKGSQASNKSAIDSLTNQLGDIKDKTITKPTVWTVGSSASADYVDLNQALKAARQVSIAGNARLTLKVENGTYNHNTTLSLNHNSYFNHPDGERLYITGNTSDPSSVVLNFTGLGHISIILNGGHYLQEFRGFTVQGDGTTDSLGIYVAHHSYAIFGELVIQGFDTDGMQFIRDAGGYLIADSVEIAHNGGNGLGVYFNSFVEARGVYIHDNGATGAYLGWNSTLHAPLGIFNDNTEHGLVATASSSAALYDASMIGNGSVGAWSLYESFVLTTGATMEDNGAYGAFSKSATLYARDSSATKNGMYGFYAGPNSFIDAKDAVVGNNGTEDYNADSLTGSDVFRNIYR